MSKETENALKRTTAMEPFRSLVVSNSSSRHSYFPCSLCFLYDEIHWLMKEGIFFLTFKLHHLFRAVP